MIIKNTFTEKLSIEFPLIMAPMFLVSNQVMIEAAMQAGIMGTFPTLNFRKEGELDQILANLNQFATDNKTTGNFGVNLIVQRTNPMYKKHLEVCVAQKVPFYITSLGNPKEVIERAHSYGAVVYCDVTNLTHAQKAYDVGADGFIAVGQGAGGHAGPNPLSVLVPALLKAFPDKPVISAGGIASGSGIVAAFATGAQGVSVGTRFIASAEAEVGSAYKNAILNAKMDDIRMSDKISGTPSTIIYNAFAKKVGLRQNALERFLSKNKQTRKYYKMLIQLRGMKNMEQSLLPGSYKALFIAGKSVEQIDKIYPVGEIVTQFKNETKSRLVELSKLIADN